VTRIVELVGVYDADHTLRGELTYWVGARLGRRHCALCDITHGLFRRRADWDACAAGLPVPFRAFHRDDQPADVRAAAQGTAPVVVARTDADLVVLLDPSALEACAGSPEALVTALEDAAVGAGLRWA
jgi:hypothetical protein